MNDCSDPHPPSSPAPGRSAAADRAGPRPSSPVEEGLPRVIESARLLAGASQLAILHNQTVYFLRETRFGKLILTK